MSRHRSFGKSNKASKKRSVLKRFERVEILMKIGRLDLEKEKKITGLPKTPVL